MPLRQGDGAPRSPATPEIRLGMPHTPRAPRARNRPGKYRKPVAGKLSARRARQKGSRLMEFAFTRSGCGWPSDCLDDPDAPPLAARLAEAFAHARDIWQAATP